MKWRRDTHPKYGTVYVSEPETVPVETIRGNVIQVSVLLRIDGRERDQVESTYDRARMAWVRRLVGWRIDRSGSFGWEAIDGGRGAKTLKAAKRHASEWLARARAERTLTPRTEKPPI